MAVESSNQRIMRLAPLRDVIAIVEARVRALGMEPAGE
jgi:hypothetical protein